jgi:hypothetical protein
MSYHKIIFKFFFYFLQKLNAYSLNIHLKYFFMKSLCVKAMPTNKQRREEESIKFNLRQSRSYVYTHVM